MSRQLVSLLLVLTVLTVGQDALNIFDINEGRNVTGTMKGNKSIEHFRRLPAHDFIIEAEKVTAESLHITNVVNELIKTVTELQVVAELPKTVLKPWVSNSEIKHPRVPKRSLQVDTESPEVVTKSPQVVTESPEVVTKSRQVVTKSPEVATKFPQVVTKSPQVVTESPEVVTKPRQVAKRRIRAVTVTTDVLSMEINWNDVLDYVIELVRKEILARGKDEIDIPDIHKKLTRYGMTGHFLATRGRLGLLSTLYRAGDVNVVRDGSYYRMTCDLGLKKLAVVYGSYEAKVWGFGPIGTIDAYVDSNALRVVTLFKITPSGECTAELGGVYVLWLKGMVVKVTGMGPLNDVASRVANTQLEKRKSYLVSTVEDILSHQMSESLKDFRCDEFLDMVIF